MGTRFTPDAADALRLAIQQAGGVEVFAIGDIEDGWVVRVEVTCRGQVDRVPALIDRPRAGQVVIHNHPSGDLRASDADMQLATLYGEDGVGVAIVDSDVRRSTWVVEPHAPRLVPVDDGKLEVFFTTDLRRVLPGYEPRPQQLEMARAVARSLDRAEPLLCEAGTGTGKSLAYLVPAALWAIANDRKVVVSTYTRSLQAQLMTSDLPLLSRAGLPVRTAVLQGRNNYVCRRRLGLAVDEETTGAEPETQNLLKTLSQWSDTTRDGSRSDLPLQLDAALWDRVMSDSDLTLAVRCPHYATCHYYVARRRAAAAHLVVVNHALLLIDLSLRAEHGRGILPAYDRVLLDEGHHLEDAATGASAAQLTSLGVRRAVAPLVDRPRKRGALSRLLHTHTGSRSVLPSTAQDTLRVRAAHAETVLAAVHGGVATSLAQVRHALLRDDVPVRVTPGIAASEAFDLDVVPTVRHLASELTEATEALDAVEAVFDDVKVPDSGRQPLLDVQRGRRRLTRHADVARLFIEDAPERCRWVAPDRSRRGEGAATLHSAPIEVAGAVRKLLWEPLPGTVATSATLTVASRFGFWRARTGLRDDDPVTELDLPSPFDHAQQAVLGLPRDLPPPDAPDYMQRVGETIVDAIRVSDGGAFVLCTSHRAVRTFADHVRRGAGSRPVLVQGEASRPSLLKRFMENRRAVLVGTDSFWEGVSVRGDGLRLVLIPRLPFRVPTEPLLQARHERIAARGGDPFRAYTLPDAVIKLRQGYGRLIRSHSDRGAVVLLDRRVHDRRYGVVLLRSLPPASRVTGPWRRVREALVALFDGASPPDP